MRRAFGIDPMRVADRIAEIAAEEIRPRFRRLDAAEIQEKGPGDLVTVVDLAMERRLGPALMELLPGSVVLGEEAASTGPAAFATLAGVAPVWVVDPLDGTANFAAGRPEIAVLVALVVDGVTCGGWIHDPLAGGTAVGMRGEGSIDADGTRLRVAPAAAPATMSGSVSVKFLEAHERARVKAAKAALGPLTSLFCAGQEYLRLLRAQQHFASYRKIMPWDHAAGVLMHAEAGGHAARHDGSAYSARHHDGGLLLAPDEATWRALAALLLPSLSH